MSERNGLEIAIIGMAGRFPKARDLEQLWRNLREGVEAVSFFTDEELIAESGLPPALLANPSYVKASAVLEDPDLFDAAFFDFSARDAEILDPQHRILLECAWQALERAGHAGTRRPVGVFVGCTQSTYAINNLFSNPEVVGSIGGFSLGLANEKDFLATRVAYKLNLSGPAYTVQTACSTSLAAVHLACQSLLVGDCELALAGGVSVRVPQKTGYLYQPGGISSPDGHCRAFDARGQGAVGGQGVGVVVLKPLDNALADGDYIHAVIKGSATNNDGLLKAGYTAPSRDGQARVIRAAQLRAEVEPDTIGYVEAHGTATPLGDPIEVAALTRAFRQGTERRGFCALGSVKTNIGHTDAAAGVASLLKATLAVERGEIPPSLHFESPNPQIDFAASPFYVASRLIEWKPDGMPRRAGVSSFGMGGTNVHVILEEAPAAGPSGPSRPWQVLALSARSPEALERMTDDLAGYLAAHPDLPLADVAFTLHTGRRAFEHRRVLIAPSEDAAGAAAALGSRDPRRVWTSEVEPGDRPVAFLLPGVGDHYAGMARGLYEGEETFRRELDRCAELLRPELGVDLREVLFAGAGEERDERGGPDLRAMLGRGAAQTAPAERDALRDTRIAQPAVFAVSWALAQLWKSWGVLPQALAGYSLGEYTAACLAGAIELDVALAFVARRAARIGELPAGAMLAVPLSEEEVRGRLAPGLSLAAVNGPGVSVVSGPVAAVSDLESRLTGEGLACRRLPTTHAFHSSMMEPIREAVAGLAGRFRLSAPKVPLLSNLTGTWMGPGEAGDPGYWSRHLCGPVRFGQAVEALWSEPGRVLLEVGPGQGLTTLALQHPANPGGAAVASLPHVQDRQPDRLFLLGSLGKLWLAGVEIDWEGFYAGEERRRLPLPTYPFERKRFWIDPPRRDARATLPAAAAAASPGTGETVAAPPPAAPAGAVRARHARPRLRNAYVPPATGTEERLVALWQTLLGVEPIGIHDNFFELGGHSLLGTQMMARMRAEAGVELPLSALFEGPTAAGLAEILERTAVRGRPPVRPRPAGISELPLSFAQQRLWFLDQLEPDSPFYNISTLYRLRGPLEAALVERAWNEIVRRHESLRTTFAAPAGHPVQVVAPGLRLPLPVVDLAALPDEVRTGEARRQAREVARLPFHLGRGPLLRTTLLRLAEEDHALGVVMHHIVSDGWSFQVALSELVPLYAAFHAGRPSPLPGLAVQYPDYALWQREWLEEGGALEEQLAFWKATLAGAPPTLDLPTDRPRPAVQTYQGATERLWLGRELMDTLARVGTESGASSFMTLLAAFATLLQRHSGQDDVVIGSPIANRTQQETELLIGFFVNTLALRTDLSGDPAFRDLLARVRRGTIAAYDHQDLPFDRLVEALQPERSLSHTPLFQVLFQLLNQPKRASAPTGFVVEPWPVDLGISTFDITFSLAEGPNGVTGALEYNVDLFERPTVLRLLAHFRALLEGIAADPGLHLSELPLLSEAERHQLRVDWNDTDAAEGGSTGRGLIHRLFEERARERPGDPAVIFEDRCLTYGELDRQAGLLAGRLRSLGVGPEVGVGLVAERSPEAIAGILGVLKTGGFYVPVDPDYPAERAELMLRDAGVRVVLVQERTAAAMPDLGVPVVRLDAPEAEELGAAGPAQATGSAAGAHTKEPSRAGRTCTAEAALPDGVPAYVIYTSGSMGKPKGVVALHRSLVNFSMSIVRAVGLGPGDRMLEFASLSFDASALQIFPTLVSGAALVLHRNPGRLSPAEIRELCERQGVTVLDLPAAVWRQWIDDMAGREEKILPEVRAFMTGGESLPADKVRSWALLPAREARLFSSYGPTEATVTTTLFSLGSGAAQSLGYVKLPLGRPLPGARVHVLDASGGPVPLGVPGEVYIGGAGLARGYHGEPALTARSFVPFSASPGSSTPGERLYRTGDLARWLPDGQLEFLGRADHQVKIRGFRVELGEIEALLASHPAVRDAVVLLREDTPGDRRLVAYVLPEPGHASPPTAPELRAFVAASLPDFMVPAFFVFLAELPLLPSGKVSRRALPAPGGARSVGAELVAPRNAVERVLADLWAQLLKVEKVGVHDNFFELGGHSLLATQVLTRVRETFEIDLGDLQLRQIFEAPTVAGLAEALLALPGRREKILATAEIMLQLASMSEEDLEAMLLAEAGEGSLP